MTVETKKTFCRFCHAACPMEVDVEDKTKVVAVRGDMSDPLFEGYTCIKGRQLGDQIHDPGRLRSSLKRSPSGTFEEISSQDALDEIAEKIRAIIDEHGPRAIATYVGTGAFQNSTTNPTGRSFHAAIESPSFYTSVTIDQPAKATAGALLGMWGGGFHSFNSADVVLALGYNPMVSSYAAGGGLQGTNPFVEMRRARERGLKLIVVDPRRTEYSTFADIHLQIKPGEDPTLLAGMIKIILDEGLEDTAFIERWVDLEELEALRAAVQPFNLEYVADRCQLDADDIVTAVHMFAEGPRGTAGGGTGPNMSPHPSLTEHLTLVLNVILGRANDAGTVLDTPGFLMPEYPRRAQVIPPSDPTPGTEHRVRGLKGLATEMLTPALADEILLPGPGKVRVLLVAGGNPAVAFPDQLKTLEALEDLELLVVMDHRMSATAELADYIFAPRLSLERADVPNLMDMMFNAPYSNYTEAIVETSDDLIIEWEVFWELAKRLGVELRYAGGPAPMDDRPTDDDVIDLIFAKGRKSTEWYRNNRQVLHPDERLTVEPAEDDAGGRFSVGPTDLMAELADVRQELTGAEVLPGFDPEKFPFRLTSRRLKAVLNSTGSELPGLARKGTSNKAYMNPEDLADIGVDTGDLIRITSPRATIIGVVESAPDVKRGVISMAHSWGGTSTTDEKVRDIGSPTNRLVDNANGVDAVTGMAIQSAIPVGVEPAPEPALA